VRLPVLLSFLAVLAAAVMAYGVAPVWAKFSWGLNVIMLTRRLQWPLAVVALLLCIALLVLVVTGKRRPWWLIGLLPVLTLFVHRYLTAPINRFAIVDEPTMIPAAGARFVGDDDYVLGVVFNEQPFAYPYACLYRAPIVVQSDRADRMLLMWSPQANAATALLVERELKGRNLDIVSDPADTFLLYNGRSGQFIVSLTGQTPKSEKPASVKGRLEVTKTPWGQWRAAHPQTRVMAPVEGSFSAPIAPLVAEPETVALIESAAQTPLAVQSTHIGQEPANLSSGEASVVAFIDPSLRLRAFDRHIEHDLVPTFKLNTNPKRKAYLIDTDTDSGWSTAGVAVDGPCKGKRLIPVHVRNGVSWSAAQFWYPGIAMHSPRN
jgi:hypothetical protein